MLWAISPVLAQSKPAISFDEFMNLVGINSISISPDGTAAVVNKWTADYGKNIYRNDLWIWTEKTGELKPLTHSMSDSNPAWSPDGKYVAFLSYRSAGRMDDDEQTHRVWVVAVDGRKAFPLYAEKLKAFAFDWAADSARIYCSVQEPMSKEEKQREENEWKDVVRYRQQDRGDVLLSISLDDAMKNSRHGRRRASATTTATEQKPASSLPEGAQVICHSPREIEEIETSPDGRELVFETQAPSERFENPADDEMFLVNAAGGAPKQLTHNQAAESNMHWSRDGSKIYFSVPEASGSIEGKYRDQQGRIYVIDPNTEAINRLGEDFTGSWESFTVTADGKILSCGVKGIEEHLYCVEGKNFTQIGNSPGAYDNLDASRQSGTNKLLYTHGGITEPMQVFIADANEPMKARAVTAFNTILLQRAKVDWTAYHWKAKDGTALEGVLIYPPGKEGQKNLPMLTLIHGGPADADGNRFDAGWYDWSTMAAAKGWLVFQPNYRGSTGYGDKFMLAISPHAVSLPASDVLSGVDSLMKEGIADVNHLAVGGYSYGGYLTNWIITQTNRFKVALSGAGAAEQAAEWGTDDSTFDDAAYLGGTPWEKPKIYEQESALFHMGNVKTPTLIAGGDNDVRVSYMENMVLERALQKLNVPHELLTFPGEGHNLDNNPWHGYILLREELKWLEKYGGVGKK